MRFTVATIPLLLGLGGVATAGQSNERLPIIDMHLHAFPVNSDNTDEPFWLPAGLQRARSQAELVQRTLGELERYNIVKAATSGPLDVVHAWKAEAPGRIIASISFSRGNAVSVDELREEYRTGRLEALGELTAQLAGLSPSDPFYEPYLALAEELDIPVGIHTGLPPPGIAYGAMPKTRAAFGSPLLLEDALVRHPKLRVYIMHAGYPFLADTIAFLHAHPHVYVDLAEINWIIPQEEFHEYLRRLVQAGFGNRLMFGSDQMWWPEAIGRAG